MTGFLLIAAVVTGLSLVANASLNTLQRSGKLILIAGTLVVVALGAYAASFVLDMVILSWAGEIPRGNIIWPCMTWSLISTCALVVGARRSTPFAVRIVPFAIFGGLAMIAAIAQPRNVVSALVLILGGVLYGWAAGRAGDSSQTRAREVSRQGLPVAIAIGGYRIDTPVSGSHQLVELTVEEYKFFARIFKNEKTYKAPPAEFLGRSWNVMLGTVAGRVWKVAAFVELDNIAEARRLTDDVMRYCISHLGKPTEERPGLITWDTRDGNVILQTASVMGTGAINLFVTSSAASAFERLR
jgi:hypothetical protein